MEMQTVKRREEFWIFRKQIIGNLNYWKIIQILYLFKIFSLELISTFVFFDENFFIIIIKCISQFSQSQHNRKKLVNHPISLLPSVFLILWINLEFQISFATYTLDKHEKNSIYSHVIQSNHSFVLFAGSGIDRRPCCKFDGSSTRMASLVERYRIFHRGNSPE